MKPYSKLQVLLVSALLLSAGIVLAGADAGAGWITLFDGKNLDHWDTTGDANWRISGNIVLADAGNGMLVSKDSYRDFEVRLEFWADARTNSGVFIRCNNARDIGPINCYEVNIFDTRPDQSGRSGAIVDVAPPRAVVDTEGHWNSYEILAQGTHLVVKLNSTVTVDIEDRKLTAGHLALQYGAGGIKFRNVRIRPL